MDYFNHQEKSWRQRFISFRDAASRPIVSFLAQRGVSPNQVTLFGVLFLLATSLTPPAHALLATFFMALYVLCDGLDGPLARSTGRDHQGGSLMDIVADQLGVAILPAAAIQHLNAWGPGMVLFASAYLIFIALVLYANQLRVELRMFVRVKYLFFLLYLLSLHLERDLVSWPCAAFTLYYFAESQNVLLRIYRHHDENRD